MSMDALSLAQTALTIRHAAFAERQQRLDRQLDDESRRWWQEAREQLAREPSANTLILLSSQCRRRLGPVTAGPDGNGLQLARALLLAQLLEQQADTDQLALLRQLFLWGDDQEKAALLNALDDLDSQGASLDLALQAGRTNNRDVFAAIALDNPFAARHYQDRTFHQLVLKTLGMGLDSRRIHGLAERRSVDLNQLALDLMEEQLAAEREISHGLPQVIAFDLLSQAQRQRLRNLYQQGRLPRHWLEHFPAGT